MNLKNLQIVIGNYRLHYFPWFFVADIVILASIVALAAWWLLR